MKSTLMPDSYRLLGASPRLGLAAQILPHTVFHAGFGLFTGPLEYSSYNHAADIAPFSPTYNIYGGNCAGGCKAGSDQAITGH